LDQLREKVEEQTEAISFREEKNDNTSPPKLNTVFNLYPNTKLRIGVFIDPGFTEKILWIEKATFNTNGKADTPD
jgi:hypothetical protein